MDPNQEQREYWNGPGGERWVTHQELLDRMVRPFGRAVLARLALCPGERVLDLGCGCGETLVEIAEAVGPSGSVTGIDLSAPMLERARQRGVRAQLIVGDAAAHPFDQPFDAMFSRFGVMFFADAVAAFTRLHATLAAEGRIGFVCWREPAKNLWMSLPMGAVKSAVPELAPPPPASPTEPGPFAFADRGYLERVLREAGFARLDIEPFDTEIELTSTGLDDAVEFVMTATPLARLVAQASDAQRQCAAAALREALTPRLQGKRLALPAAAWLVLAHAR
jgi:SAM-dependent methyltransferase